jgi:anti-sigma regulatory factor (Ser/Thr protein kinase)
MVYFNQAPISPLGGDLDQRQRLHAFRQELQKQNLVWDYDGVADFEKKVRRHLTAFVRDWPRRTLPLTVPTEAPGQVEDGPTTLLQGSEQKVDLRRESQLQVVAASVRSNLGAHGFGVDAANRATVVLLELLANARDHTESREASVKVEIRTEPIRVAVVEVSHDGEPFDLDAAVQRGLAELQAGEREHGLLKALRLASHLRLSTETPPGTVAVECDVYDPPFLGSGLLEDRPDIAPVYREFDLPTRWRIGRETYVDRDLWQPLRHALQKPSPELLPLYFGDLRAPADGYLAIEFVGRVVVSEVGSPFVAADVSSVYPPTRSLDVVEAAFEVQFNEWFASGRVVMYGHEVGVVSAIELERWATLWGLPCFTQPHELEQFLGSLD